MEPEFTRMKIRDFLHSHTVYELIPESGKVVLLDVDLPIRQVHPSAYVSRVSVFVDLISTSVGLCSLCGSFPNMNCRPFWFVLLMYQSNQISERHWRGYVDVALLYSQDWLKNKQLTSREEASLGQGLPEGSMIGF